MAKKDGPEGDGQAAVQCKRMGDPTAWAGSQGLCRSAPEARGRYYRTFERKGRLGLCASAEGQKLTAFDFCPWASWSAALLERMSRRRIRDLAPQSAGGPPAEGLGPAQQPPGAIGLLNGTPVANKSRSAAASRGRSPPLLDTRTLFRQTSDDDMSQIGHSYSGGEWQTARDRFEDIGGNAILYTYPTGDVDIICASDKWFSPPGWEAAEDFARQGKALPAKREKGKKSEGADMLRSMRRARAQLRRLALANSFEYFVTLTLDKEKIDRFDGEAITRRLNQWCSNMVKRHGLRYVIVPERHKDGAWHFHGFFAGSGLQVVDSGTIKRPGIKEPRRPADETERQRWLEEGGRIVYNLPQWPYGFTTAMELYGQYSAAVAYVCKYIGKQEGERPLGRWYYSGGSLAKPEKKYAVLDYRELAEDCKDDAIEFEIPGSRMLVIHSGSCG